MTLQEVMAANGGFWDKEYAMIQVGQYVKCVAVGNENSFKLTPYGESQLANMSSDVVVSEPKRRGRKAAEPQPAVTEPDPVVELDDLDL